MATAPSPDGTEHRQQLWCYNSFKTKAQVEAGGGKLLRCGRCQGAWYASKDDQRANWPLHKYTCRTRDPRVMASIDGLRGLKKALRMIEESLVPKHGGGATKPVVKPETCHLLRKMRDLMGMNTDPHVAVAHDRDEEIGDIGLYIHGIGRFFLPEPWHEWHTKVIWAAPGMPEFLLTEPLTSPTRRRQEATYDGSRGGIPDARFDCDLSEKLREERQEDTTASEWAYLIFNLLIRAAIGYVQPSHMSAYDGDGRLRTSPLAKAALSRAWDLYVDVGVRDDCGDALAPGLSFVATDDPARRRELLSRGLPIVALEEAVHSSMASAIRRYAYQILKSVRVDEWRALPVDVSLDLLVNLVESNGINGDLVEEDDDNPFDIERNEDVGRPKHDFKPVIRHMVDTVLSPAARRMELCRAAAMRRRYKLKPYQGYPEPEKEARVFFLLLLMACEQAADPMQVDVEAVYVKWKNLLSQTPPSLQWCSMMELLGHDTLPRSVSTAHHAMD